MSHDGGDWRAGATDNGDAPEGPTGPTEGPGVGAVGADGRTATQRARHSAPPREDLRSANEVCYEGQVVDVRVDRAAATGDFVGYYRDAMVMLPAAEPLTPGETVTVDVEAVRGAYAVASVRAP